MTQKPIQNQMHNESELVWTAHPCCITWLHWSFEHTTCTHTTTLTLTTAAWNTLAQTEKCFMLGIAVFLLCIQNFLFSEKHNGWIMKNKAKIFFYYHALQVLTQYIFGLYGVRMLGFKIAVWVAKLSFILWKIITLG